MSMKKVGLTNIKLKVGSLIEGYLLGVSVREIDGDNGKFDLAKLTIKDAKLGPSNVWVQGDYAHVLVLGLKTRVSKVETLVDGEKGTQTVVEQDETDKITV